MPYNFHNLDGTVRRYMLDEIRQDIGYRHLNVDGLFEETAKKYPELLITAAGSGNAETLIKSLKHLGLPLNRVGKSLIETEFNRFYMRGVCLKAIEDHKKVSVYLAKSVLLQRSDAKGKVGQLYDPNTLLMKLRMKTDVDEALNLLPGKISGLSIEIVE